MGVVIPWPVAIDRQPLVRQWPLRHVTAQPLEFVRLYRDDAHRHLYPLSDWDPVHHGQWLGLAEASLVAEVIAMYLAYFAFVMLVSMRGCFSHPVCEDLLTRY
ncbi:MAG: hypothetical protein CMO26_15280 [Thiotrichales bacterium]|nr:hypothetical protein [Thiotrichales bacterium]